MMSALPPRSGESPRRGVSRLEMMQVSLTGFFYLCLGPVTAAATLQSNPFTNQAGLLITSWEILSIIATLEYTTQKLIA